MLGDDPRLNTYRKRFEHVSTSKNIVCTGESFGSYNFAHIDEVYPRDRTLIPIENDFGGIDYLPNPNYHPE